MATTGELSMHFSVKQRCETTLQKQKGQFKSCVVTGVAKMFTQLQVSQVGSLGSWTNTCTICKLSRERSRNYRYLTQSGGIQVFVSACSCKLGTELRVQYSLVQMRNYAIFINFVMQLVQMRLIHAVELGVQCQITMVTKHFGSISDHGMHGWRWCNP